MRITTCPINCALWIITAPSPYDPSKTTTIFGPATLLECLEQAA
jgi:hypothetical protein